MNPVQDPRVYPASSRDAWGDEHSPQPQQEADPTPAAGRWQQFRARLVRFYRFYNPAKLVMVDDMLRDAHGSEEDLFEALIRMYGPEPPAQVDNREHRRRLAAFYQHYNPARLPDVDGVLADYRGREDQLFAALVHKYGPEPGTGLPPAAGGSGGAPVDSAIVSALMDQNRRLKKSKHSAVLRSIVATATDALRRTYYYRWLERLWWAKSHVVLTRVVDEGRAGLLREQFVNQQLLDQVAVLKGQLTAFEEVGRPPSPAPAPALEPMQTRPLRVAERMQPAAVQPVQVQAVVADDASSAPADAHAVPTLPRSTLQRLRHTRSHVPSELDRAPTAPSAPSANPRQSVSLSVAPLSATVHGGPHSTVHGGPHSTGHPHSTVHGGGPLHHSTVHPHSTVHGGPHSTFSRFEAAPDPSDHLLLPDSSSDEDRRGLTLGETLRSMPTAAPTAVRGAARAQPTPSRYAVPLLADAGGSDVDGGRLKPSPALTLRMDLSLQSFSAAELRRDLGGILSVRPRQVEVLSVERGSVIARVRFLLPGDGLFRRQFVHRAVDVLSSGVLPHLRITSAWEEDSAATTSTPDRRQIRADPPRRPTQPPSGGPPLRELHRHYYYAADGQLIGASERAAGMPSPPPVPPERERGVVSPPRRHMTREERRGIAGDIARDVTSMVGPLAAARGMSPYPSLPLSPPPQPARTPRQRRRPPHTDPRPRLDLDGLLGQLEQEPQRPRRRRHRRTASTGPGRRAKEPRAERRREGQRQEGQAASWQGLEECQRAVDNALARLTTVPQRESPSRPRTSVSPPRRPRTQHTPASPLPPAGSDDDSLPSCAPPPYGSPDMWTTAATAAAHHGRMRRHGDIESGVARSSHVDALIVPQHQDQLRRRV